jgi:hypothetical protein
MGTYMTADMHEQHGAHACTFIIAKEGAFAAYKKENSMLRKAP